MKHSGRYRSTKSMCTLPACCKEERKEKCPQDASALLFISQPPIIFYTTCHLSTCHFSCLQNFVSIYSPPVSPSQAASLSTVLLPCCHSPPTAAGRWLSLKSETAVCDCGWPRVTRGEGWGSPSRAGPRECSAAPFERPPSPSCRRQTAG